MTQTLWVCLIWMYEAVWGGNQPQLCGYRIILIPQVTLISQIWGQLGWCNGIRVHPYALEPAYQWLKHFVYVLYGCMEWSEVDISLNHEVIATFSLYKWPWVPKSGANLANVMVWGCTHMPLRQHTNGSNSLCMIDMDVWSGLRWISASTMTKWHHLHSSSEPEPQNLGPTWPV